jgi:starch-binding outer membrane protein, SusD/RagB family
MRIETMQRRSRSRTGVAVGVLALLATAGCDSFFEVDNPNVIDASTVDPVQDGAIFSRSAFQTLASAYGSMIVYTGWFTDEARVGDTFPTRNEYGRREVDRANGTHNGEVWFPITRSIAQGEQVIEILGGVAGQELNLARGAMTSAFGLVLQGEAFCEGTMRGPGGEPGNLMTPQQLLEVAVNRFDQAIAAAGTATGAEATNILNASRVGKGRALLQLGRGTEAAQAVAAVPATFTFTVPFVDDPGNRGRLGNGVFGFSAGGNREALVVPPHYRTIGQDLTGGPANPTGDPRVPFRNAGRTAQDNTLQLWTQLKYPAWSAGIRLASGLEARYIAAEGSGNVAQILALVNERRAAGGEGAYTGTTPLAELMRQRSIDFWLEAKRLGDFRRRGALVPNILQPGPYYKDNLGNVFNQTCFPIPQAEIDANKNING